MSKLAVIPARGGSKRIPRKNIRLFAGKPMIAYAIEAALSSGVFDHVVVSTDDPEIAGIAADHGASLPFVRPAHLADDMTPTVPVVAHAIETCQALGWGVQQVCCIYPGVPFIQASDLVQALDLLLGGNAHYVFPVTPFPSAIQRALRRQADYKRPAVSLAAMDAAVLTAVLADDGDAGRLRTYALRAGQAAG